MVRINKCGKTFILRTSTVQEINNRPNASICFPMLSRENRQLWNLSGLGLAKQVGITDGFEPQSGYGNWFWGCPPSCLESLLKTAGFRVDVRATGAFVQTLICSPVDIPFEHHLPSETEAHTLGVMISSEGLARPA